MKVTDLLDAAKAAQGLTSDNQLAKAVGVSRAAVSSWRHGLKTPDAVACAALAGLSGEPLARVLGIVGEARAISREEKAVWRKLAATATLLLIAVVPLLNPAAAAPYAHGNKATQVIDFVGIMRSVLNWLKSTFCRVFFRNQETRDGSSALLA